MINAILNTLPVSTIIACIIAITIKEFTKAFVSTKLGDKLPTRDGRLTLNPLKHIEPIGLFLMVFFRVGWGKPVETSPLYYSDRKKGTILTYTLPSVVNFFSGIVLVIIYYAVVPAIGFNFFTILIMQTAVMNFSIAIFNIIPIPPLDGAKVLSMFLSPNAVIKMASMEKLYQILLLFLIIWWSSPLVNFINRIVISIITVVSQWI